MGTLVVILVSIELELRGEMYLGWSRRNQFEKSLRNTVCGL